MKDFFRSVIVLIGCLLLLGVGPNCGLGSKENQVPDDGKGVEYWKPGPGSVAWGSSAAPFPGESGVSRIEAWTRLNTRIKSLNGGYGLIGRRSYDTKIPVTFAESAMAPDVGLCPVSIGSFKPSWKETADGVNHDAIKRFVQSVPDSHTVYLVFHHEPEDEALSGNANYSPELLQTAFARFVDVVLSSGKPNVHPCFVLMSWTFNPKSGRNPEDFNLAAKLKPWQMERVVAGLDGYADVPAKGSAKDIFDANFKKMETWGFTRFGIFETATHPVDTKPDREEWISGLGKWVKDRKNIELVSWFHSAVGQHAGEKGWYLGEWYMQNDGKYSWSDDGSLKAYARLLVPD